MRDYKKFYTPDVEADFLVALADIKEGNTVLEPSAGDGQIVRAIKRKAPDVIVDCVELNESCYPKLVKIDWSDVHKDDFLAYPTSKKYDRIVANPPFNEDIWILHLLKMYDHLNRHGILVCIVPVFPIKEYNESLITGWYNTLAQPSYYKKFTIIPFENWTRNSDGSYTEIQIVKWIKE